MLKGLIYFIAFLLTTCMSFSTVNLSVQGHHVYWVFHAFPSLACNSEKYSQVCFSLGMGNGQVSHHGERNLGNKQELVAKQVWGNFLLACQIETCMCCSWLEEC